LAHFKLEDTHLYTVLFEAAEKNSELKHTLEFFAKDMAGVSTEMMRFFEQCHNGGTHHQKTQDIGNILFLLQTRIRREEDTLYAVFDKLQAAARIMVARQIIDSRLSMGAFCDDDPVARLRRSSGCHPAPEPDLGNEYFSQVRDSQKISLQSNPAPV